ncbi:vacuolar proton ATPase, putative [Acanthamoeba castellanii str. Neff]|uniref:V-type proton ATPase subunit a n=1 Tax=Acanthamoeba castellanii (strain ATCC 30010 / Neff) TaxID=1257118 RepID=L8HHZ1_ACACF|nr:vacuolar proton ATPase, putative [Acanthamoeba castellanii str. Neff]ELR24832.1 vacuolar proton ATPase, putative [Acanthamoeba castellanii str. Neff]
MGELFRSEPMQLVQLFMSLEAARDTVDELGEIGLIQFKDLNPEVNAIQRNFVAEVKRCDEMERKLRFFEDQIEKQNFAEEELEHLQLGLSIGSSKKTLVPEMDELEARFEDLEKELTQMNSNQEKLKRNYNELIELKHVLEKDSVFFESSGGAERDRYDEEADVGSSEVAGLTSFGVKLGFVTGVVERSKMVTFERVLWRATRGNLFMRTAPIEERIEDPKTNELVDKLVFIIFFQGDRAESKVKKICESFGANLYPCPDSAQERREMFNQVETRLDDLDVVLERSLDHRKKVLLDIATHIEDWKTQVVKEKSIYHNMNLFNYDVGRKCLIAEGWCPLTATEDIQDALKRANERSGTLVPSIVNVVKTREQPPTHFKTNKFTKSFQGIVDAYGMARYREVNPGVFTIVTFPFLFGMMFGDVGHGIMLFIFAVYLCIKEDTFSKMKLNEMVKTCFDGRYLLLLMALGAIYCGALYNEVFSVPLDIFGSRWQYFEGEQFAEWTNPGIAYPFGVDPAWKGAKNELLYYNSIKMKLSIIFGVTHMVFGILLSALNGIYFKKPYNIWFEFVPQLCFMMSIFGYMVFLIFFKWSYEFSAPQDAPNLLNLMISMFLKPFKLQPIDDLFPGQLYLQWVLIAVCAISVPMMLLPKPLLLRRDHKRGYKRLAESHEEDGDEEEEEFDFNEIFIHQIIHTIEFVLGAISNTASYLRLWALSLAHSELATVFWERVLVLTLEKNNFFLIFVGFAIWAGATFGVLLVMESLSAFLHALRLHWVEFQNKFYMGDGYKFQPFSYQQILSGEEEGGL